MVDMARLQQDAISLNTRTALYTRRKRMFASEAFSAQHGSRHREFETGI